MGMPIAWVPVTQREVWRVEQRNPWNGGLLLPNGMSKFEGRLTEADVRAIQGYIADVVGKTVRGGK